MIILNNESLNAIGQHPVSDENNDKKSGVTNGKCSDNIDKKSGNDTETGHCPVSTIVLIVQSTNRTTLLFKSQINNDSNGNYCLKCTVIEYPIR